MVEASCERLSITRRREKALEDQQLSIKALSWQLARAVNQLEAARALTTNAITVIQGGDNEAAILPAAHAKKFATEFVEPALDCVHPSNGS